MLAAPPTVATTMAQSRILIIEDERALTKVLSYNLQREGYKSLPDAAADFDGTAGRLKEVLAAVSAWNVPAQPSCIAH